MIEHTGEDSPMLGLIGQHPNNYDNEKPDFRHVVPSRAFGELFDVPTMDDLRDEIRGYFWGRRGPIGDGLVVLSDRDGKRHEFRFETFYNGYDALTLGVHI